jgi:hypothetical protein
MEVVMVEEATEYLTKALEVSLRYNILRYKLVATCRFTSGTIVLCYFRFSINGHVVRGHVHLASPSEAAKACAWAENK